MNSLQEYIEAFSLIQKETKKASNTLRNNVSVDAIDFCSMTIRTLRCLRETAVSCDAWIGRGNLSHSAETTFLRFDVQSFDGEDIAKLILEVHDFMTASMNQSSSARISAHVKLEKKLKKVSEDIAKLLMMLKKQVPKRSMSIVRIVQEEE